MNGLNAYYRWCLTGTPIQNSLDDLFTLVQFLKIRPYHQANAYQLWKIRADLKGKSEDQYKKDLEKLRLFLSGFVIRRSHKEVNIDLPPLKLDIVRADFEPEEKDFYESMEKNLQDKFRRLEARGVVMKNYSTVLVMLLRLRQLCDHHRLVLEKGQNTIDALLKEDQIEESKEPTEEVELFDQNALTRLLSESIEEMANAECPICFDDMNQGSASFTSCCGQAFHKDCCSTLVNCPLCRHNPLKTIACSTTIEFIKKMTQENENPKAKETKPKPAENQSNPPVAASKKIKMMLETLKKIQMDNPGSKTIIFSQFTAFLNIVELHLGGYNYVRYDGSMTRIQRDKVLERFKDEQRVSSRTHNVLLTSLFSDLSDADVTAQWKSGTKHHLRK
jgi:SNF2 family DNA or RNA helicase